LTSDISDSNYKTRLVQEGATNEKVLRVKAKAVDEPFQITQVGLSVGTTPANAATLTITYPTDAAQTTMESKTVALVGGVTDVSGMHWYVPANVDSYASVTAAINVDTNGALSGNNPFIVQMETQNADLAGLLTKALGVSSGTYAAVNTAGNADSIGNPEFARKTLITIDKAAGSPAGSMVPGSAEFLRINISNSSGSSATVSTIALKTNAADSTAGDWGCGLTLAVYDSTDLTTDLNGGDTQTTLTGCVGAGSDAEEHLITLTPAITISAGSSKTLQIWTDTTGASSINHDTFRMDVIGDTAAGGNSCNTASNNCLDWNDGQAANNGYKVDKLPITGGNIQF